MFYDNKNKFITKIFKSKNEINEIKIEIKIMRSLIIEFIPFNWS
jgi:hypothetical protein